MKTKPSTTKTDTRKSRKLFGLSADDLKMVLGGTGVIVQHPNK